MAKIQIVVWKRSCLPCAMTAVKVYIPWRSQLTRDLVASRWPPSTFFTNQAVLLSILYLKSIKKNNLPLILAISNENITWFCFCRATNYHKFEMPLWVPFSFPLRPHLWETWHSTDKTLQIPSTWYNRDQSDQKKSTTCPWLTLTRTCQCQLRQLFLWVQ